MSYPRETKEYVLFEEVLVNGVATTNFEYAVTKGLERPTAWSVPVTLPTGQAFLLDAEVLGTGSFRVWVRISDPPQYPIVHVGTFNIS